MKIRHQDIVSLPINHPGAHDKEYRKRRDEIALLAKNHNPKTGTIPEIKYTTEEHLLWNSVVSRLDILHQKHASSVYLEAKNKLNISNDKIPQLKSISEKIEEATGFKLAPVEGLVDARSFLSYLGERTMLCTQYIRHSSKPEYTPEPDIIHELIGHAPMFMNNEFADFSERLGKLAWCATDKEVKKIERLYWFTIEFGLIKEGDSLKAFGAGLLSSLEELKHAFSREVIRLPFNTETITKTNYDYSKIQDKLFIISSLKDLLLR
jgi:phenylalanine-4-hydroxylase